MSTLTEIEAAADQLPPAEQEALFAHLATRLNRPALPASRPRVSLPLIECGPPGSLPITSELIARAEEEQDAERHAASL